MSAYGKLSGEVELLDESGTVISRVNNVITKRGLHWLLAVGFGFRGVPELPPTGFAGDQGTFYIETPPPTTGTVQLPAMRPNEDGRGTNPLVFVAGAARLYSQVFSGVPTDIWFGLESMLCPFRNLVASASTAPAVNTIDSIAPLKFWATSGTSVNTQFFVEADRFGLVITANYVAGSVASGTINSIGFSYEDDGTSVGAYAILPTPINCATDTRTINYRLFVNT